MKRCNCTLYSAIVLILLLLGCNKAKDVTNDEEAIKFVINAETHAWIDKNPEKMKQFYVQDKYQTRLNIQDSIYTLSTGWDKRSTAIDTLAKYADWRGVDQFQVKKDFLVIKVMGNTAWAILRETQKMVYNGSPATAISIINIVLEKQNKDWKISCFVKSSI